LTPNKALQPTPGAIRRVAKGMANQSVIPVSIRVPTSFSGEVFDFCLVQFTVEDEETGK